MKRNYKKGFTLAEMLMAVLVMSIIMIAMAPVMTKKAKESAQKIEVTKGTSVPVGAIVLWYGDNIPRGWIECRGQDLSGEEMIELKAAIGDKSMLPDLNPEINGMTSPIKWIIKSTKD